MVTDIMLLWCLMSRWSYAEEINLGRKMNPWSWGQY